MFHKQKKHGIGLINIPLLNSQSEYACPACHSAEAQTLMGTKANLCTPRNGAPLIAAIQDFITGAFLLTQKDMFLTKSQASMLAAQMLNCETDVKLPTPAFIKPVRLWTGKQLITLMLKSNKLEIE